MRLLDIIFEDEHLLVINKPAGLATQAPAAFDSLERRVRDYLQGSNEELWRLNSSATNQPLKPHYLGLPHRLDRPVSGVIVLAKTLKAAQKLSKQFEHRRAKKIYWAVVAGIVEPTDGTWTDWVQKIPDEPRVQVVADGAGGARPAVLHYRVLERGPIRSLLEIRLETGRMHQIRVQAASRGWPVLGDALYGSSVGYFGEPSEDWRQRGIGLHARRISVLPPGRTEEMTFEAPLPASWPPLVEQ